MIYIATDHRGLEMKKYLVTYLKTQLKKEVEDLGADKLDPEDDYVDYATKVAKAVQKNPGSLGILLCGSGHGVCVTANKFKGIRASIGYSIEGVELGKRDDNLNVLCLAARIISNDHAAAITKKFLETELRTDDPKYQRRIKRINQLEG